MAKKLGKFLLATAAIGTAAVAAYYYMQKKDAAKAVSDASDDDYDDFSDDLDEETASPRTYVSLNSNTASDEDFTPLTEQIAKHADDTVEETVEEFFDEEDSPEDEPPILND